MADRRVKVIFEAELGGMKKGLAEAAKETEKLAQATEKTGKTIDERMQKVNAVAAADQKAAKAAGLLYNAQGQLSDSNGKVLSSTQAAAHGVEAFSEAVYLSGHEAGVAAAATEAAAKKAAEAAEKQKAAWQTVAPVMMAAGAGMVAGVGMAVKKYADFDKAMSSVDAATHETAGNMAMLREEAIRAGADTAFSAAEAAQGIEELAKAGVSTSEIMGGGLTGALDLAAAGELGVGKAAEIASSAMTQFKLGGDQVVHLADLLAAGAGKAQGGVEDLGAALGQAGLVASSTGLSIEETVGGLTAFASAGLMGSDAGTSFKSMLQRLTPQSKVAQRQFDDLGISAYDANGEFIGLAEFAGVLQESMKDLTPEARNAAMGVMFGSDAVRASTILYDEGAEGIQKWIEQVDDAGYAAETAGRMQNNLAGDLEKLGGAFDTVFIQSGGTGNDMLRGFVQAAEGLVDVVGKIPAPILGVGTIMAGVAGGALLLGGGLITAIPKIKETRDALRDIAPAGSKADRSLRGVGKAAGLAAAGVGALSIVGPTVASWVGSGNKADPVKLAEGLRKIGEGGVAAGIGLADLEGMFTGKGSFMDGLDVGGLEDAFRVIGNPGVADNVDNTLSSILSFGTRGSSNVEFVKKNFAELDTQLASMVSNGMTDQAGTAYEMLAQRATDAGVPIEKLVEIFPGYNSALANSATAAAGAAAGTEDVTVALDEVGVSAEGAVADMEKFLEALFSLGNATMDSRDAAFAYQEQIRSITDAQKEITKGEMGRALNKTKDDFNTTTEAGKLANDEFQGLARKGMDEVAKMSEEGLGQDELQKKLNTTYTDLVKAGEGFGLSGKAAKELAREVLGVPEGVDVKTWMDDRAKAMAEGTKGAIEAIPGYTSVSVAVSEDGTAGEVQSKINEVTGKTEYVFVTDDGTVVNVQQKIENVNGVERTVYVGDDGTVYTTQGKIDNVKNGAATVNVTDNGTVSTVQQKIWGLKGGSVTVKVGYSDPGSPISFNSLIPRNATGGRAPGLAGGGRVPATGLGTDMVMGVNERGIPHVRVDDREWVINRRSSDKHDALLNMINRDDPRLSMLQGLAGGGKVSEAAKKSEDARKEAVRAQKELQARLSESRRDLYTDLRRGNITDAFTSGSGMGQVDELREASRSTDYSMSKRRGLARDANALEKSLTILTKKSENLKTALESATDQADELRSVRDSVAGDLRGEFSLSGMLGETRQDLGAKPFTARGISGRANAMAKRIEIFAGRLNRLRKMGYGETIIQEVAGLGTEDGITVAGVLMNATKGERNSIVGAYGRLDSASNKSGQYVTESMRKGGLSAADGLVNGLQSKTKQVESAFYKLGKDAERSFKRSLGIKSPSKSAEGWMSDVVDGSVIGVDRNKGKLESAMYGLGLAGEAAFDMQPAAFSVPPSAEVARYAAQPAGGGQQQIAEAVGAAVHNAMSSYQPMVNIGGTKFYGVMSKAAHEARKPL